MIIEGTVNKHLKTGQYITRVKGDEFDNTEDWYSVPVKVDMKDSDFNRAFQGNYWFKDEEDKTISVLLFGYSYGKISINNQPFISRSGWGYDWKYTYNLGIHSIDVTLVWAWYNTNLRDVVKFPIEPPNSTKDCLIEVVTNISKQRTLDRPVERIGHNKYWTRLDFRRLHCENEHRGIEEMRNIGKLFRDELQ